MRPIHRFLILLLLSLSMLAARGQKLDSLLKVLQTQKKDDSKKLNLLNVIAKRYEYLNISLGLRTADTAIALGKKINDSLGLATAIMIKGQLHYASGDNTQALQLYNTSLEWFEALNNKGQLAACLTSIGAVHFALKDYDKALSYYQRSISISEQVAGKSSIATTYNNIGAVYSQLWNLPKALEMFQKGAVLRKELGDLRGLAVSIQNVGTVYVKMNNYPKALEYYQQSLALSEKQGPISTNIMNLLSNIGIVYSNLGENEKALEYYKKVLVVAQAVGKKDSSVMLYRIGVVYAGLKQSEKAEKYFLESINTSRRLGNRESYEVLYELGLVYKQWSDFSKAWRTLNAGLAIAQKMQSKEGMGLLHLSLGNWFRDAPDSALIAVGVKPVNRYDTALYYLNTGRMFAEQTGAADQVRLGWQDLSLTYIRTHQFDKALDSYKKYIFVNDSIANKQNEKKVSQLVMQYEFDKKSDSMKLVEQLTLQKLEKQVLLATQQQQEILLAGNRLELSKNQLELSNKEKDLEHLAFLSTQSSLENEQLEKQGKIKELELSESEKQLQAAHLKSLTQEKKLTELKRQQQFIYFLVGLALLCFMILFLVYRARLQKIRFKERIAAEKMLQEKQEIEFQRQLGEVSMSALRSQMNPHFVFNCLNSIKLYTEQNNTAAASAYLTKFSKLIRQVLDNSRTDKILLSAELNALGLYIDMEAMRFKDKLKYSIKMDKNVDADYIEIPPMLLQPYVENAIWHGLMQREEGGRIDISVSLDDNESFVVINIKDNGIGRTMSALLKSKTATKHKSHGMKVTSERLALTNARYKTEGGVTVTDLFDYNGTPAGTSVTVKIPID